MVSGWHDFARAHQQDLLREAERRRLVKTLAANRGEDRS